MKNPAIQPTWDGDATSLNEGLVSSATGYDEADIERRLSIVERAIRLQTALGASHLQQVELDPAAFGVPPAARTAVRKLRRERNKALHGVVKQPGGPSQVLEGDRAMTKDNLLGNSIPEHIDANGPLSVDPRIADTADPAEPRGVPQLEVTLDKKVDESHRAENGADQSADATGDGPGQVGKLPPRTARGADSPADANEMPPITNGPPDSQAVQCQGPGQVPKLPPRPRRARSGVHKSRPAEGNSAQGWNRPSGPTQERVDEFRRYLVQQGHHGSYDPAKLTDAELLEAFLSD